MSSINSYLTFNGNCREAMTFYQDCLGGELILETMGDSLPIAVGASQIPGEFKSLIVQATLICGDWLLIGSDLANEKGRIKGNAVAMMLHCDSKEEAHTVYRKLSQGGEATHPLNESHWGAWFGDLVDPFGNHWLIQYDNESY
jgi:PhnB protein